MAIRARAKARPHCLLARIRRTGQAMFFSQPTRRMTGVGRHAGLNSFGHYAAIPKMPSHFFNQSLIICPPEIADSSDKRHASIGIVGESAIDSNPHEKDPEQLFKR
jgi:hypothetical protein